MTTLAQIKSPKAETTTSFGGENIVGFRVVRSESCTGTAKGKKKLARTLAEANKWLMENAAKVDRHAKASTKRLIGRETV
jgi:hypothetical protein